MKCNGLFKKHSSVTSIISSLLSKCQLNFKWSPFIVEVFTVLKKGTKKLPYTDVRFSAHGSPYYASEKLEGLLTRHRQDIERDLAMDIVMIHIDECLIEGVNCPRQSCANNLDIDDQPVTIYTNRTSFVGVQAVVRPVCRCSAPRNSFYHR